jgi:hypothetical protein
VKAYNPYFNFICYYFAWYAGISLAAHNHPWLSLAMVAGVTLVQILWQWRVMQRLQGLLQLILIFVLSGFVVDSVLLHLNYLHFNANPFKICSPPWMIGMWFNFCVVFYSVSYSYFKSYSLMSFASLLMFPLSYWLGAIYGSAVLVQGWMTLAILGLIWSILMPLNLKLYNAMVGARA